MRRELDPGGLFLQLGDQPEQHVSVRKGGKENEIPTVT
jgi:hypothetical protein